MELKKILFIQYGQFGYLSDYYYYCKYLSNDYKITFLCIDEGFKRQNLNHVQVKYASLRGNKIRKYYQWLKFIAKEIYNKNYDLIFTHCFKLCFVVRVFGGNRKIILDIRTGSVKQNRIINFFNNQRIRFESFFFKNITILSKGLIKHLGLKPKNCHWLPLGAEQIPNSDCGYDAINLLYVGTLKQRNIHHTIEGFAKFYEQYGSEALCCYNIVGFGSEADEKLLNDRIHDLDLNGIVKFHGRRTHGELVDFFRNSNVGVSYVPITHYFDFQPPTKTFEYILSGMVCIATSTYENTNLISEANGILCLDNSISFYEALKEYYFKRHHYNHSSVINSLEDYTWNKIVNTNLKPYLNTLLSDV